MWWSDEMIAYYRRAAERSSFHSELADIIAPMLPRNKHISELGCGLGYLSAELASRGFDITGIDSDEKAISFAKEHFSPSIFSLADAYSPLKDNDTSICVFFGQIREEGNLEKLLSTASNQLIYVSNEHARGDECSFEKSHAISEELKQKGIKHTLTLHRLSFDQPLKDMKDAKAFISASYRKDMSPSLIPSGSSDFPYLLPKRKAFGIFRIFKEEIK